MPKKSGFSSTFKFTSVLAAGICAAFLVNFSPSAAQLYNTLSEDLTQTSSMTSPASITAAFEDGQVRGQSFQHINAIKSFYKARDNQPFWTAGALGHYQQDLIDLFEESWSHGLNPAHYNLDVLSAFEGNEIERELLLMDGFVRYARDLSGMRVDGEGLKIDQQSWRQKMSPEEVLAGLSDVQSFDQIIKNIHPRSRTYELLRRELIALSKEPEPAYASVLPLDFGRVLRPNMRHKKMADLRIRFGLSPLTQDERLYDDRLVGAVIKFQRENGLSADGVIGPDTLRALNRTNMSLMRQLIANLERLRWAPEERPEKYVVVNIPSAALWAVDQGRLEFEMPVIVGRPKRATESFIADITGVRFNPHWTVPPTIKRRDMLPKLQEDPDYLINKGIELYAGYGHDAETLDPTAIDWEDITMQELNGIRMVQSPGKHNALGQIRVLMPNAYNIYLHDTNERNLFNKPARAVSSGCIRLKHPQKIAHFIMRDKEGWDEQKMHRLLASQKTKERYIEQTIPVYIFYYTAWIDSKGRVVYGTDIYGQDKVLVDKLAEVDGFRIPGHNVKSKGSPARSTLVSVK